MSQYKTNKSRINTTLNTTYVHRYDKNIDIEQKLLNIPEHMSSSPVFSGVRVTRSLVLCVVYCRLLFVLLHCCSSSGHYVVCSLIYGLPLWYLQTLLDMIK